MSVVAGIIAGTGQVPHEIPFNGQQINLPNGPSVEPEQKPEGQVIPVDVVINNVVCSFSTKCHLNLKRIAMEGTNVEYHRQHGVSIPTGQWTDCICTNTKF